jgi:dTDP-4-amino-4,6-dideoxygalactose transaminase
MRGAKPVFADVDRNSQNITADTIKKVITSHTRAIVAVHLAGWPCEMDTIMALAKKNGLVVIEDCAQASGAFYKGCPVGSFGDAAAFSFCHDKIMTTGGEGGMVVTNSKHIWSKVWSYKDHGKSYDAVYGNDDLKPGPSFKWLHESFGTNWRMTEMQAAIGRVQLRKLPVWIERRRRNAYILTKAFLNVPALRVTTPPDHISHAYYKYYVFLKPDMLKTGWDRKRIIVAINAEGIPCFTGSCSEIYLEKAFDADGMRPEKRLPVAEELGETAVMFLVHPTLSENDMLDMVRVVEKVMAIACR